MAELGGGGFNEKMIFQLLKTHRKAAHMKGAYYVTTVVNGELPSIMVNNCSAYQGFMIKQS